MILAETKDLIVECDTDNAFTRRVAEVQAEVLGQYQLEDNDNLDPIGMKVRTDDGTVYHFVVRYKKLN